MIDLGIGEPDFKTPDHIKKAAYQAIKNDETRYTLVAGTPMLRTAIRNKLKRDNNLDYPLDNITVSGGAKQVIFNAFMASLSQGDEVIVPSPNWPSYLDMVAIADGTTGECRMPAKRPLPAHAGTARGGDNAEHPMAGNELTFKPDRRGIYKNSARSDRQSVARPQNMSGF